MGRYNETQFLKAAGSNSSGELGIGSTSSPLVPTLAKLPGDYYIEFFVDSKGFDNILVARDEHDKQVLLGVGSAANSATTYVQLQVDIPQGERLVLGSGQYGSYVFYSASTKIYTLDNGSSALKEVTPFNKVIQKIDSGNTFSIFLGADGNLYSFGQGNEGQLGLGKSVTDVSLPTQIPLAVHVKDFSCGPNFVVYCNTDNELYGFGDSTANTITSNGVGLTDYWSPSIIATFPQNILSLSTTYRAIFVLTDDNNIRSYGLTEYYGAEAHCPTTNSKFLNMPPEMKQQTIISLRSPLSYVIFALPASLKEVWCCGRNDNGECGRSGSTNQFTKLDLSEGQKLPRIRSLHTSAWSMHFLLEETSYILTLFLKMSKKGRELEKCVISDYTDVEFKF